jgi:hypothetical protein
VNDSVLEKEKKFYKFYFDGLDDDISTFYDPLKKKLKNHRYRSISIHYLKHVQKSALFKKDLVSYCRQKIEFDILKEYPMKLFNKFIDNKKFLENLDISKSKFEWTKFEMEAAIFHFLYVFELRM